MNIIEAIHDPRFFRPVFRDLDTWGAWFTYLRALFGLPLNMVKEGKLYEGCTGLETMPGKRFRESFVIAGRRSGKSFISAVIAIYLATFKNWSKVLSVGERGFIFIIANDKSQARIIKNYVSGILKSGSSFRSMIMKDKTWEVDLNNCVTIAVHTCSFRTLRGYSLLAAICEELAFWRSEDSANPDREILTALRPALAQFPDSMLLGISTPYSKRGVLFDAFKKHYGQGEGPLIWRAGTTTMNPTIDKKLIEQAFDEDPQAALSEYDAVFRTDLEALIPPEAVEAVTVRNRFELPFTRSLEYYGFIDPSGGRVDSFSMAISHKNKNKRVVLDVLKEVKPPFAPEAVVKEFADVFKSYKIHRVEGDKYAGEWVVDAFKRNGLSVRPSKKSKSEIYLDFLPLINSASIELLDLKKLAVQLTALERRVRSGGKDVVDHPRGFHDDLANAAAGALVLTDRRSRSRVRLIPLTTDTGEKSEAWEQFLP
jgi:hypothetical protein